jgi:glycerate kinase
LYQTGIVAAFSLTSGPMSLEQACGNAEQLLKDRAQDILRLWLATSNVSK